MGRLFGTDGIRGIAGVELTPEMAFKAGRAAAYVLTQNNMRPPHFLVARDTRISGPLLEAALTAGLASVGATVYLAGVISTPATAYLTRYCGGCGGVMISASHNDYPDNGLKFFNADGFKLPDESEEEIERLYFLPDDKLPRPSAARIGRIQPFADAEERYLNFLLGTVTRRFDGYRVVLDCANGAVFNLAPHAFRALGAEVAAIHASPDGLNINKDCGSTNYREVAKAVRETGADLGFAFDGDADRVLAVNERGELVDGDAIMAVYATHLQEQGRLRHNTLVATVMSNIGLDKAAEATGFRVLRTKVGDRYVLEEMLAGGYNLGGEQSGHIIMLDHSTTGDGLLAALQLMSLVAGSGRPLSALSGHIQRYPQVLVNCRVARREGLAESERLRLAVAETERILAGRGRLLVRPSGTEPLVRVMLEGPDENELHILANKLADIILEEFGEGR
jgi:phosphoglucosamine mutase